MNRRRVKITGLGFVTPAGIGKEQFYSGIMEEFSRVKLIDRFPKEAGPFIGAEVNDFNVENYIENINPKRMPRHTQFAVAAAQLALSDAGIGMRDLKGHSPAVVVGASLMDFGTINKTVEMIVKRGQVNGFPSSVFSASVSSISGTIGEHIGGSVKTLALQSACCAGLDAIGYAAEMIATGGTDFALCGGTESPLFFHPMLELKMAGLAPGNPEYPERQCRPFDRWRTTGAIGEGACILLLEPESSSRAGYAYIDGYSFATDSKGPPLGGLTFAMNLALANAGKRPDQIDTISAWGPGHRIVDAAEVIALKSIFQDFLPQIPVTSIKGSIGNALGAAGAIQVGCAALGMLRGSTPPTVNWVYPDPECRLNLSARSRFISHTSTLVNAHGLSGTNASMVLVS